MKNIKGGITVPKGFLAVGNHVGVKRKRKDLALIVSKLPAKAAAVFTMNVVKAAPLVWNKTIIDNGNDVKAIVVNSGNANACTGEEGYKNAVSMAEITAKALNLNKEEVLVASTGVIGVQLPMDKISDGIKKLAPELGSSIEHGLSAAQAIMTTDTFYKEIAVEVEIGGKTVSIGGIAKGSGMIHPNMATMLAFLTTDANISTEMLRKALKETVDDTFNMISVDGDTSTNDMVIILANGAAENKLISEENQDYETFKKALHHINRDLAMQIIRDGEGATKFLEIMVTGVESQSKAKILAKSIINSNLVKTAFFGEDANWGRIIAAMGYSGAEFDPSTVSIEFRNKIGSITLMNNGDLITFDEEKAKEILKERDIQVLITLQEGKEKAVAWGSDLSYEYVRINADYRT